MKATLTLHLSTKPTTHVIVGACSCGWRGPERRVRMSEAEMFRADTWKLYGPEPQAHNAERATPRCSAYVQHKAVSA